MFNREFSPRKLRQRAQTYLKFFGADGHYATKGGQKEPGRVIKFFYENNDAVMSCNMVWVDNERRIHFGIASDEAKDALEKGQTLHDVTKTTKEIYTLRRFGNFGHKKQKQQASEILDRVNKVYIADQEQE